MPVTLTDRLSHRLWGGGGSSEHSGVAAMVVVVRSESVVENLSLMTPW